VPFDFFIAMVFNDIKYSSFILYIPVPGCYASRHDRKKDHPENAPRGSGLLPGLIALEAGRRIANDHEDR